MSHTRTVADNAQSILFCSPSPTFRKPSASNGESTGNINPIPAVQSNESMRTITKTTHRRCFFAISPPNSTLIQFLLRTNVTLSRRFLPEWDTFIPILKFFIISHPIKYSEVV